MINRPDEDHLTAAAAAGRALFTHNTADYCALHQKWMSAERTHAGIIVAPQQRYSVGEELRRIVRLISRCPAEKCKTDWNSFPRGLDDERSRGDHVPQADRATGWHVKGAWKS